MAIGTPVAIGTVQNKTEQATTVLTTTAAVPAGAFLVVAVGYERDAINDSLDSISDGSNTYVSAASAGLGSTVLGVVADLFYVKNAAALASSSSITLTWTTGHAVAAKAISAFYVEGIDTTSPLDQTGDTTNSNSAAPTVSTAGATSQADEITIGIVATEGPSGDTFTQDASPAYGTPPTRVGTTGGAANSNITLAGGYFIETATGTKTYNPTLGTARDLATVIATFKGAATVPAPPPPTIIRDAPTRASFW